MSDAKGKLRESILRKRGIVSPIQPQDEGPMSLMLRKIVEEVVSKNLANIQENLQQRVDETFTRIINERLDEFKGEPGVNAEVDLDELAKKASLLVTAPTVNEDSIVEKIIPRIPSVSVKVNEDRIARKAASLIKIPGVEEITASVLTQIPPSPHIPPQETPESFLAAIHSMEAPIKMGAIQGLNDMLRGLQRSIRERTTKMIHGGGASIKIGSVTPGILNYVREEDLALQGTGSTFTLAHTPLNETTKLYRGGARQQSGALNDYTRSGAVITLSTPLVSGESLIIDYVY